MSDTSPPPLELALALAVMDASRDGMALVEDERIVAVNAALRSLYALTRDPVGLPLGEALKLFRERVDPSDVEAFDRAYGQPGQSEFRLLSGKVLRRAMGREFRIPGGRAFRLAVYEDITREHELRDAEQRMERLFERLPFGIAVTSDEQIRWVNAPYAALLGAKGASLVGHRCAELLSAPELDRLRQQVRDAHVTRGAVGPRSYAVRPLDGRRPVQVEATLVPYEWEGRSAELEILRDVTEEKQLQAKLMLADRMASVGTLAAGAAHELNNPLAYVAANLSFLEDELQKLSASSAEPAVREVVVGLRSAAADAAEGAQRMKHIIRDLKGFSGEEDNHRTAVDLRRSVDTALGMAWTELKHRARVVREMESVPTVTANEARVNQLILNLLLNAAHAITEGDLEHNEVRIITRELGDGQVLLEVRDTGAGIPPDHLSKVFDPFFTTKAPGRGTGLGLAVCHHIVTSLAGSIEVESTVGKGTTVRVLLPTATSGEERPAPLPATPRARLLVIDDEPLILSAFRRTLASQHDVVGVGSAREALQLIADGERFDLIFCDVMMPEMTGVDFYATLESSHPERAREVIFMSGGAYTPKTSAFLKAVPNRRIDKPFAPETLRRIVADELGARRSRPL